MEIEIQRFKETPPPNLLDPASGLSSSHCPVFKAALHPQVVRSSTSGLDISAYLRGDQDTDLKEAALRLAKAEEICRWVVMGKSKARTTTVLVLVIFCGMSMNI